jgi:hypothetical protein
MKKFSLLTGILICFIFHCQILTAQVEDYNQEFNLALREIVHHRYRNATIVDAETSQGLLEKCSGSNCKMIRNWAHPDRFYTSFFNDLMQRKILDSLESNYLDSLIKNDPTLMNNVYFVDSRIIKKPVWKGDSIELHLRSRFIRIFFLNMRLKLERPKNSITVGSPIFIQDHTKMVIILENKYRKRYPGHKYYGCNTMIYFLKKNRRKWKITAEIEQSHSHYYVPTKLNR